MPSKLRRLSREGEEKDRKSAENVCVSLFEIIPVHVSAILFRGYEPMRSTEYSFCAFEMAHLNNVLFQTYSLE